MQCHTSILFLPKCAAGMCCGAPKPTQKLLPDDMEGDQTRDCVHSHSWTFHWHAVKRYTAAWFSWVMSRGCREQRAPQDLYAHNSDTIIFRTSTSPHTTMFATHHMCMDSLRVLNACSVISGRVFSWLKITIKQSHVPRNWQVQSKVKLPGLIFLFIYQHFPELTKKELKVLVNWVKAHHWLPKQQHNWLMKPNQGNVCFPVL